jgi:uncharacterized membrane protein YkvA (DUF1232 family)
MKLKEHAKLLRNKTSQIYIAMISPQTPWYAKILAFFIVAYALSPIDLIPDFIPILGYLDDIIIIPFLISLCIKMIPKELWLSFEEEAKLIWINGTPKKWYLIIPIIVIWFIIIFLLVNLILKIIRN